MVKTLSLGSCFLVLVAIGFIIIPAFSQGIINLFLFLTGVKLDLLTVVSLLQNMWVINLLPKIIGAAILIVIVIRSHLRIDYPKMKQQIIKILLFALICLMLVGAVFLEVPIIKAEAATTTQFALGTALPIADWYIGKYSTGYFFAISSSNWGNLMLDIGNKDWNSYSTNYTKIEQIVLEKISAGTIYLKEVPFNLTLMSSIPTNVSVICNINGEINTYINPATALGSQSYTISTGLGNNAGYYVCTDSEGRILQVSSNASSLIQSAVNSISGYGTVNVLCNITVTTPITILQSINYVQQGVATLKSDYLVIGDSTHLVQGYSIDINDIEGDGVHNGITFIKIGRAHV
jgi:hypothetical protein